MKTDLYTKITLTIIAIALVGHLIKDINFVSSAQAEVREVEEFQDNRRTNRSVKKELEKDKKKKKEKEVIDVNIVQVNGREIGHDDNKEQIPVYIKNSAMPVYFKGIPFVKVSNYYDFVPNNGTARKK